MKDYYLILQIHRNASTIEIKNAFRNLSKKYHPDINKSSNATQIFIEIKEAYEVLIDENRRKQYNLLLDFSLHSQNININPKIQSFYVDSSVFQLNQIITFTWEVIDADVVELRPFGIVPAKGTKKIKITDAKNNSLLVELYCYNSISKNYVFSQINLIKEQSFDLYFEKETSVSSENNFEEDENLNYFLNLIRENPHINPKHFEKEKLFSLYNRLNAKNYKFRFIAFTIIYLLIFVYFVSQDLINSLFFLLFSALYYTLIYIQTVKRFHDLNSEGSKAFITVIPIFGWIQCFSLFNKKGDEALNNYGLPNEIIKSDNIVSWKDKFDIIKSFSNFEKIALGTAVLNIVMLVMYLIIPKYEIPVEVLDTYSLVNFKNNYEERQYFVETSNGTFEISEKLGLYLKNTKTEFIYLGKNALTHSESYLLAVANSEEIKDYVTIFNTNNPISLLYFFFLCFVYFVFFVDKKMKYNPNYETILGFMVIINLVYLVFYIL